MPSGLKQQIQSALQALPAANFRDGHLALLQTLGYSSEKTIPIAGAKPKAFLEMLEANPDGDKFDQEKALFDDWKKADLLFQLTNEELSGERSLFEETEVKPGLLQSYLFFAIELNGKSTVNGAYARGKLTAIARQINRVFPMPVMVLIQHPHKGEKALSVAVINRRVNKREQDKDVLGKVTIIRDISLAAPHRGHLEILESFSVPALTSGRQVVDSFDSLHSAWEEIFNVELLNKKFYRELSNWYFWAMHNCHFPLLDEKADKYFLFKDREKVREHEAKNLIRLLTRILFVWFIKQKDLVPGSFFDPVVIEKDLLKQFGTESKETNYYKAILQNLFFATLNQTHGKREFRKDGQHHNTTTLLRYKSHLKDPDKFVDTVEGITPFLNGGLFDCLDYPHPTKKGPQGGAITVYEDGFSDRKDNPLVVPDYLFFGAPRQFDLSKDYGEKKRNKETVRGLIHILDAYKFTIVENTPVEQEIALDPELLGQVFENLLASYNPETERTARKQTGSFYTPRPIVDYMVDQSLKAYLKQMILNDQSIQAEDTASKLEELFAYTEQQHRFSEEEIAVLIRAIDNCKILDPACGSGAFPMGTLQKLVYVLGKLDPRDELWEKRQLSKVERLIEAAQDIDDITFREHAIADIEEQKRDIEEAFAKNELGYGRKLYLIENCLYGVDIQSIATQVSKLRFFISLVVDQKVDKQRENFGIRPLPNLETRFISANSLIPIEKHEQQLELGDSDRIHKLKAKLKRVRHRLFSAKTPQTKKKCRAEDEEIRGLIASELKSSGWASETADKLAFWNPYDQNASESYFDPEWMFGQAAFDIVIQNPPFGASLDSYTKKFAQDYYEHQDYQLDTYLLFVERGFQLLKDEGVQSLIIPNTWLQGVMFKSIRRFVFGETRVLDITNVETSVFSAVVDNTILTHAKSAPQNSEFPVWSYTQDGFSLKYNQNQCEWFTREGTPVSLALTPHKRTIAKLINRKTNLEDFFTITPGCKPYQRGKGVPKQTADIVKEKPFTSTSKVDPSFQPLLRGKLIQKYHILWKENLWIKFGAWLAEPRLSAQYDAPQKIVIRQTGDSLIAALDTDQFIVMNNMFSVVPKHDGFSLGFALAALNSTTLNWYYQNVVNPEVGEALAEIKKGHLVRLPLPYVSKTQSRTFDLLVSLIGCSKSCGETYYSQFLEDLIDACVMEVYFGEHMAERKLLFHDETAKHLRGYTPEASEAEKMKFLERLVDTANEPTSTIRNCLLRLTADSPELLAVIKREGQA